MLSFDEIISQKKIISYFREAIKNKKLSHAYIISADEGMGKKTLAFALALELMCTSSTKPCFSCKACKKTLANTNLNIVSIGNENNKLISIKEIREQLIEDAYIGPFNSEYKIYIINFAHNLSKEAQNALLKIIESPPEYVIILLLTNNIEAFLDTIKSRCIKLNMEYLTELEIKNYLLAKYELSLEDIEEIVFFSRGNLGLAKSICEDKNKQQEYVYFIKILKNIKAVNMPEFFEYFNFLKEDKNRLVEFIKIAHLWYRDILFLKFIKDISQKDIISKLIFKKEYASLLENSRLYTQVQLDEILKILEASLNRLKLNINLENSLFILLEELR